MTPPHVLRILEALDQARTLIEEKFPDIHNFRRAGVLLRLKDVPRDKMTAISYNDKCVGMLHEETYQQLRIAAVEHLKLIPFPSDQELGLIIYCGAYILGLTHDIEKAKK